LKETLTQTGGDEAQGAAGREATAAGRAPQTAEQETTAGAAPFAVAPSVARPRLGFLGVGWIGRHRMEAIARDGAAEVALVAEPSQEAAASAIEAAPGSALADSFEALLDSPLDGIVIATPSALHAEQSVAALERGLAVFCQKPLARTGAETRRVVEAARGGDRLLGVDLSYRHIDGAREMRELARSGALGEIFAADLVFHNAYGPDKQWFYDPRLSGGGCVIDLGIHLVDLALWVLDYPRLESAAGRLFAGGRPLADAGTQVEDYATARLDFEGGATARLACSWRLHAGREAVIEATFYGTRGGVSLRNLGGSFYDFEAEHFEGTSRRRLGSTEGQERWSWGGRAAVEWARRLASGSRFDAEAERLVEVAAALDAIYGR
jgi:predicted dehydrogenase